MLKIRTKTDNEMRLPPLMDINKEFSKIEIHDSKLNRKIIKEIEQGEYFDTERFIDRFKIGVRLKDMSTGCKAALLVANTDKEIDTQECGENALYSILNLCNTGSIVVRDLERTFWYDENDPESQKMDAEFNGRHFTSIPEFNDYLTNEYGVDW
jgi:hypothetical protein